MLNQLSRYFMLTSLTFFLSQPVIASCNILNSNGELFKDANDPLHLILNGDYPCPDDVFKLRQVLKDNGLHLKTTIVANRGFHNPKEGSFSLFEMPEGTLTQGGKTFSIQLGDFFFGHFTTRNIQDELILDQHPKAGSLMIEVLAWDTQKGFFNFYELRGNGKNGQWFYRGNSLDIFADNTLLHRQPYPNKPEFGSRLRCSGCHGAGGPIMKEIHQPHNDWWEPIRQLDFGGTTIDPYLKDILNTLSPASTLAKASTSGLNKLNESDSFYTHVQELSLQEQLRPLFCPVALNLMSDDVPNDEKKSELLLPFEFFVDSRLLTPKIKTTIKVERSAYEAALINLGSHFPETERMDADHAWLTPVKAKSDQLAISNLVNRGLINNKFVADVLAIDMTNPIFSKNRCQLLKYVPLTVTPDWQTLFIQNLAKTSELAAKQLIDNLSNPHHTVEYYQDEAKDFLTQCRIKLRNPKNVEMMMKLLAQRRAEIRASEISANPKGQILEPGFRVIFPEIRYPSIPGDLTLTKSCEVIQSSM